MDPSALSSDLLTRHSSFLRALARGLLVDDQLAEDACQEALLATLREPPPEHVNPLAWLATLTRRAALRLRRSGIRREARESTVARAEAQPSGIDALAQAELMMRVCEAVVGMPEPYRLTLLARYYEELTPTAIATRDGLSVATVKSRLTRAHALLRERLDRVHGDREQWRSNLTALCGLSMKELIVPAIAMKTSVKVGLIAAALLAVFSSVPFVLDWSEPRAPVAAVEPAVDRVVAPQPELPTPSRSRAAVESNTSSQASHASIAAPTLDAAAHTSILLYGFVRPVVGSDKLALPVHLKLTDQLGEVRETDAGADGAYSFEGLSTGRHWLFAQATSGGKARTTVDLNAASAERRLDIQLTPELDILVSVVDSAGNPIPKLPLIAVATLEAPGEWLDEISGSSNNRFGFGDWKAEAHTEEFDVPEVIGRIRLVMPPPLFVSLLQQQRVVATQRVAAEQRSVRFVLDPANSLLGKSTLRFRLIDAESRAPLPEIHFRLLSSTYWGMTGLDGSFSGTAWPGWTSLRIFSAKYGSPELSRRVEAGVDTDFGDIPLSSACSISGQVVDGGGTGKPGIVFYADAASLLRSAPGSPSIAVGVAKDGSFRIDGLSRNRYRLRFVPEETYAFGSSVVEVDLQAGSVENVKIKVERGTPLVVSATDERWPLVHFDVIDAKGVTMFTSQLFGPEPQKIPLAPGQYEMEVRIRGVVEGERRKITIADDPVELSLP